VDGTGSESCPVVGFGISGVEPWGSAITVLDLMEIGCEDGWWLELAQDHVGIKRPEREADHSLPSSAEVKNTS
jgi:hypothetical protein